MDSASRCRWWHGLRSLSAVFVLASAGGGAEPGLESVREHYAKSQGELQQVRVHWRSTVELLASASGDYVNRECRAAIRGDKMYYDVTYTTASGRELLPRDRHRAMSYDGKETWILLGSDVARIHPGDERRQFDTPDDFLALQGYPKANYRILFEGGEVSCDLVGSLTRGEYRPAGTKKVEEVPCLEAARPSDRVCFDPKRGYAILQREVFDVKTGQAVFRFLFRDLAEVKRGIWLAREIVCETFRGTQLQSRSRLKVLELDVGEAPDQQFQLQFEPGVAVMDLRHYPEDSDGATRGVVFLAPADPQDLDKVIAAAVESQRFDDLDITEIGWLRGLLWIGNAALVGLLVLLVVWRKLRRKAAPS